MTGKFRGFQVATTSKSCRQGASFSSKRRKKSWTPSPDHDIIFRQNLRGFVNEVYHAKLNDEGRMVIPADCRRQTGLQPGQDVLLKVTPEGLLLTSYEQDLNQFQNEVASLVGPGVSLVDEVIADRRAEATKEASE
jgi:bifunctional DNA-binding transcriptional regulator/antitoxin component of YhaV-PrlF toxin-antitoxin module